MQSTLIRFTDSIFADSYRTGDLYLSSLSSFWDFTKDGSFNLSMLDGIDNIYWRGCLDKYDRFASQKEWRVCWLPTERNFDAKILHVGSLDDIVDIVATKDIRRYLLNKYSGYVPGLISNVRKDTDGTES